MKLKEKCSKCGQPIYSSECPPFGKSKKRYARMTKEIHVVDGIMVNCGNLYNGEICGTSMIVFSEEFKQKFAKEAA